MPIRAGKDYFLVRISTLEQADRAKREGSIFLPHKHIYMTRHIQAGELLDIGRTAQDEFPEAEQGDTLLFHHFVENREKRSNYIFSDKTHAYYVVKNTHETYGCIKQGDVIPHKDYVFLETARPVLEDIPTQDIFNQPMTQTAAGLFVYTDFRITPEMAQEKIDELRRQIDSLCKSGTHKPHIQKLIKQREDEIQEITKKRDRRTYEPYTLIHANSHLNRDFHCSLKQGDILYCLNIACQTKVIVQGTEMIVARSEYVGGLLNKKES